MTIASNYTLRLPKTLRVQLERIAKSQHRSLQSQILVLLEAAASEWKESANATKGTVS